MPLTERHYCVGLSDRASCSALANWLFRACWTYSPILRIPSTAIRLVHRCRLCCVERFWCQHLLRPGESPRFYAQGSLRRQTQPDRERQGGYNPVILPALKQGRRRSQRVRVPWRQAGRRMPPKKSQTSSFKPLTASVDSHRICDSSLIVVAN